MQQLWLKDGEPFFVLSALFYGLAQFVHVPFDTLDEVYSAVQEGLHIFVEPFFRLPYLLADSLTMTDT